MVSLVFIGLASLLFGFILLGQPLHLVIRTTLVFLAGNTFTAAEKLGLGENEKKKNQAMMRCGQYPMDLPTVNYSAIAVLRILLLTVQVINGRCFDDASSICHAEESELGDRIIAIFCNDLGSQVVVLLRTTKMQMHVRVGKLSVTIYELLGAKTGWTEPCTLFRQQYLGVDTCTYVQLSANVFFGFIYKKARYVRARLSALSSTTRSVLCSERARAWHVLCARGESNSKKEKHVCVVSWLGPLMPSHPSCAVQGKPKISRYELKL